MIHEKPTHFDGEITGLPISEFMALAWGCLVALSVCAASLVSLTIIVAKYAESWTG